MSLGKIQLVEQPALPAKCVCCNNQWKGSPDHMVDFQASVDEYGALLFCTSCAGELANLVLTDEVNSLNDQIRSLTLINRELQENNDRLNATLDSILSVRPDVYSNRDSVERTDSEVAEDGERENNKLVDTGKF